MKKFTAFCIVALCLMPLGAREGLSVAIDLGSIESFFFDTAHLRLEVAWDITEEFGLRLPVTLTAEWLKGDPYYLEAGLFIDYYPLGWPFFLSLSLAQVGVLGNQRGEDDPAVLFLNEMAVGWKFSIPPGFVLTPMVIVCDPNRVFEGEYAEMGDIFTRFPMVRCALLFGWTFPVGHSRTEGE